jgi:regulatory protein
MIDWEQKEKFENQKSKVMNYIMYKKRSEFEVRQKFSKSIDENTLDDIIEYVKEAGYLNDTEYIERAINEFIALKNLSIFEIKNKLYSKGISRNDIEDYIAEHREELEEYEKNSKENIILKKSGKMDEAELRNYLYKKGYIL